MATGALYIFSPLDLLSSDHQDDNLHHHLLIPIILLLMFPSEGPAG